MEPSARLLCLVSAWDTQAEFADLSRSQRKNIGRRHLIAWHRPVSLYLWAVSEG